MKVQNIEDIELIDYNGVSLDLVSHNELYDELVANGDPLIIINDYVADIADNKVVEVINGLIRTHFGTAELNTVPSCLCGLLHNRFNEGLICEDCNTPVMRIINRKLTSNVWIRPPEGFPAFIQPRFWSIFNRYIGRAKFNLLEYLTCRSYIPGGRGSNVATKDKKIRPIIELLEKYGIERGMKYFYDNFDYIMKVILTDNGFNNIISGSNARTKAKIKYGLQILIHNYRHCIFSSRLPFPSRLIMVSEEDKSTGYIDKNMPMVFNAVKNIVMLERPLMPMTERSVETKLVASNKMFAEYYALFRRQSYSGKPGISRKQQGATRSSWSGRATVSPEAGIHNYDEITAPWVFSISLLRVHIINKLFKLDFTPYEMYKIVDKCMVNSEGEDGDILEDIMNTLIDESPSGGIDLAMLRNPTLERLAMQLFKIIRINRNTNMNSVMLSVLAIKGSNCDYDGDQLQMLLVLDARYRKRFNRLKAHLGLMDADHPRRVKSIITLHAEMITMVNNFLSSNRVDVDDPDIEFYEESI